MSRTPCYLLSDNPLDSIGEKDSDSFQFKPFVETFVSLAMTRGNKTPFTVVVDGQWGSGKTTLMKMTLSILDKEKVAFSEEDKKLFRPCKTFWFNAWKYSSDDSLLAALLMVMFKGMEKDSNFWEAVKTKIDGESFMAGMVNKYVGKFTGGDANDYLYERRLAKSSAFLDKFTEQMKMLIRSYCSTKAKEDGDQEGAFVIFIDDLDRCPPGRVLQVLEALKLFLDIPGCIFFLGMEVDQVKEAIRTEYEKSQNREGFEPSRYLEKIIQIHVCIPPVAENNMENYFESIFSQVPSFKESDNQEIKNIFLGANFKTQRAVKRAVNDFLFLESLCQRMGLLEKGDNG